MLRHALASSRYFIIIAVLGALVASLGLLGFGLIVVARGTINAIQTGVVSPSVAKSLAVGAIEAVDVFLIAIAVYITSLGLYALFVDEGLELPRWLEIHDFEDLKRNLISIVIAVLAVLFLREAVAWDGARDLLSFGVAIAVMIAALTIFLRLPSKVGPAK